MFRLMTFTVLLVSHATFTFAQEARLKTRWQAAAEATAVQPAPAQAAQAPPESAAAQIKTTADLANGQVIALPASPNLPGAAPCSSGPATGESNGYDADRGPYIETTHADGSVRREFRSGIEITAPDGSKTWYPVGYAMSNSQPPTPPELPSDPAKGLRWLQMHNDALQRIIATYLGKDQASIDRYAAREQRDAGDDLFKLITYRTEIAAFYASRKQ